jgi:hypothetical protein
MTEGILHSMAKIEKPIEYAELNISTEFYKKDELPSDIEIIEMNRAYLIDEDNIELNKKVVLYQNNLKYLMKTKKLNHLTLKVVMIQEKPNY